MMTAEQFLDQEEYYSVVNDFDTHQAMIKFAKLHVEAALKTASEKAEMDEPITRVFYINKNSILQAYSLENIK
jgi:hypothetical protein